MNLTDEDQANRRRRLALWVAEHGGHAAVVRARNLTGSHASHLSQILNGYSFGERAARGIEKRLGMPARWLDQAAVDTAAPVLRAAEPSPQYGGPSLSEALEVLGMALARDMPADVRQDVADALAKLAARKGLQRHQEELLTLLGGAPGKAQCPAA